MFMKLNEKRGQNTAEYAILIGVIVAAAIAMQIYVRRGMQARIKDAVDYSRTGDSNELGNVFVTNQFEPYAMNSSFTTISNSSQAEQLQVGGGVVRDNIADYRSRTGNQTYGNYAGGNTGS